MKKLLGALALFALALVLVLVPSPEAKAESPVCPECQAPCSAVSNGDGTHHWACGSADCPGYRQTVGDPEPCSGGAPTCTAKAECEKCGAEYGQSLGHDWVPDTALGKGGWVWEADGSSAEVHLKCQRNGCGELAAETDSSPVPGTKSYSAQTGKVTTGYTATVTKDGKSFTDSTDVVSDPIPLSCAYLVAGVYYKTKPGSVPQRYDCHYEMDWWTYPQDFGQVIEIDGNYYLAAQLDTMVYTKAFYVSKQTGSPATCTEDGKEDYWKCSECGRMYSDRDARNEIQAPVAIKAPGHDLKETKEVPATCTEPGVAAYWTCQRDGCGKMFSDAKGENPIERPVPVEALGHDIVNHEAKAPGCTEIGWEAYDTCSRCDYSTEYVEKSALGHDIVNHEAKAPSCTEIGWDAYDTCSRCDYTTYAEKAAPGHDIVKHEAKAPACTGIGWDAYDTCSRCDYTTYAEKAALGHDIVKHEAKAPSCTEIGWDDYDTCSRCDYTTYAEKAALGHDLAMTAKVEPTCTEPGTEAFFTCRRSGCGRLFSDKDAQHVITAPAVLPATGHTEAADPAVDPTCTTAGLTEGSHCSVCEAVLAAQEEVPALGHSYSTWKPSARRRHAHSCFRCGDETSVACFLVTVPVGSDTSLMLCPVCGYRDEMENMEAVQGARISGKKPDGNPAVFVSGSEEGLRLLSVAFESDGKPVRFAGEVTVALPAELISGCSLVVIGPDGTESPVEYTVNGDWIEFILSFPQDDQPGSVQVLKLIA